MIKTKFEAISLFKINVNHMTSNAILHTGIRRQNQQQLLDDVYCKHLKFKL